MEVQELQLESPDIKVFLQVLKLDACAYVWVGSENCSFGQLSTAIQTRFSPIPSVVDIWGGDEDLGRFLQRMAKRTGYYLVFSLNLPSIPADLYRVLEASLIEKLVDR